MAKYRKKPVVIDAFRLGVDFIPDWFMDKVSTNDIILHGEYGQGLDSADIKTLEGVMTATAKDWWVIRGVEGEIYPIKDSVFRTTYEPVSE